MRLSAERWAEEQFGRARLGDVRRTRRLVAMAARAAKRPAGKVTVVFDRTKEREGAYDFLESQHVEGAAIAQSMFAATAAKASVAALVYVVVDFSHLTFTDGGRTKDFGPIGSPNHPARGVMAANALAISPEGIPLGLIDQQFWVRDETVPASKVERNAQNRRRPFAEKQGARLVAAAENASRRLPHHTRPWLVIDREGDNQDVLLALSKLPCDFTIRANRDRCLGKEADAQHLRASLRMAPVLGRWAVRIPRSGSREARSVTLEVRAKPLRLLFSKRPNVPRENLDVHAVWVREAGDSEALDWVLYTNCPVSTEDTARKIIDAYRARWRIEEFHRTWKRGECNVESAQLRSADAVVKWATILAAVAARIERLKYLARETPGTPASVELGELEIAALKMERRDRLGRKVRLPTMPSIAEATAWIAELGGWMGQRSSGPPGSVTLARGLDRLSIYAHAVAMARTEASRERT
jgi:hypothetical protein